jgi:alcohol dehydrogenase (cytochrome c)
MYLVDIWGTSQIDVRSGTAGRIVWRMDPKQERVPERGLSNRGVALSGNFVISAANFPPRIVATNKDTGKIAWETNVADGQDDLQITAAPLAVKDKVIVGAAGGDRGVRDWIAALDAKTGRLMWRNYVIPAPGEPGSETWKDPAKAAWRTGGGAMWVTGSYDVTTNQVLWGTGNPVPMFDATYRPGDNLYTNSVISWDPDSGKMNWYFQYTPGDHWDYDEVGSHILIDGQINGEPRKVVAHSARNGFFYAMERANGQMVFAKPYLDRVNWTKGLDLKTGKPVDSDPTKDIQTYADSHADVDDPTRPCARGFGRQQFWPTALSRTKRGTCRHSQPASFTRDPSRATRRQASAGGRPTERRPTATDRRHAIDRSPASRRRSHSYPNYSGALARPPAASVLEATDGTLAAFDDTTMGNSGRSTWGRLRAADDLRAGGKQCVAILSGLSVAPGCIKTPELKNSATRPCSCSDSEQSQGRERETRSPSLPTVAGRDRRSPRAQLDRAARSR